MQGVKDKELGNVLSEMLDELVCQDKNVPYGRDNMSVIFIRIKKG